MINSEPSFYGTESVSPTTEDIRRFSKRIDSRKSRETKPTNNNATKSDREPILLDSTKKLQGFAVKLEKSTAFSIRTGPIEKPKAMKVICQRVCYASLGIFMTIIILAFVIYTGIIPIVFATNLTARRQLMFVGWVRNAPKELQEPWKLDLPCSRRWEIQTNEGIVAAWYIPPSAAVKESCRNITKPFLGPNPVVLFVPSLEETRVSPSRLRVLRVISQNLGHHILTFDYRGTADSGDALPSVTTVVSDTIHVCAYLQSQMRRVGNKHLLVWGDTWGAAIALQAITNPRILKGSPVPKMMILQTPIESTLKAAGKALNFNQIWRWMPLFQKVFVETLEAYTETNLNSLNAIIGHEPLSDLVLHAEDDDVVSIDQGRNVYNELLTATNKTGKDVTIRLHSFPVSEGLGHEIVYSPNFVSVIKDFIDGSSATTISQDPYSNNKLNEGPHISNYSVYAT